MSLNIKNKEAYTLASEIAQLTGQSMTTVVIIALRRHRQQLQHQPRKETLCHELMAIAKQCAAHLQKPGSAVQHSDMFYDEQGLPQ